MFVQAEQETFNIVEGQFDTLNNKCWHWKKSTSKKPIKPLQYCKLSQKKKKKKKIVKMQKMDGKAQKSTSNLIIKNFIKKQTVK